ncbi:ribbon-helix-helix protein, CopG family [Dactylosporangium sp. NBC_01737]|uniref:YlcI/YnfO family protein n=1 Tax=Dactylosporangium sp. NBC_01737 TaxID=2975959 RepID=UPI002E13D7D0|nr:ribbon-helix-helix protein, CopG family [Dactylosporangium sp. NBC_01737]
MNLSPYVAALGRELLTAVETGGDDAAVVERLTASMESAIRLALLEALSAAADEITRELAPGSVQVLLRGRDPEFVVTPHQVERPREDAGDRGAAPADDVAGFEDGATTRINVRLPDKLKAAVEEAAAREGRSVNAWLVRAASTALRSSERDHGTERRAKAGSQHYTGWAR